MMQDVVANDSRSFVGSISRVALGDVLRQVSGVSLKNQQNSSNSSRFIGTEQLLVSRTTRAGKVNKKHGTKPDRKIHWIDGTNPDAPLLTVDPHINAEQLAPSLDSQPFDLLSLGKVHQSIRATIAKYLTEKTLPVLPPRLESQLAIDSAAELPKIVAIQHALAAVEGDIPLARQCQENLSMISSLIQEHLCPGIDPVTDMEHEAKASRVLKSERAIQLFHALTAQGGDELAFKLELESIELATELNHAILLQDLERCLKSNYKDASVASIKEGIVSHILPELSKDEYQDPNKLTEAIKTKLFPFISPIVKYVVKNYPHTDSAYLLGPNIHTKKANCSGKAMMLNLLLQDVGLDTRVAIVHVDRAEELFGHAYNHVYLPNHALLEIDGNQSNHTDQANSIFGCNVAILVEKNPGKKLTLDQYPSWYDLMATHNRTYVLSDNLISTYIRTWGTETHKICTDENGKLTSVDTLSMLLDFNVQQFDRLHILNYAIGLLNVEETKSTNHPQMAKLVARAIFNYAENTLGLGEDKRAYYLEKAINLTKQSIREMPHNIGVYEQLLRVLSYQLNTQLSDQEKKEILIDLEKTSLTTLRLKRTLPETIDTDRSQFSIASPLVNMKQTEDYQKLVLGGSLVAKRNDLKESIILLEGCPIRSEESLTSIKLIEELREKLVQLNNESQSA